MKLTNKQKDALEIISGKQWSVWSPIVAEAYFSFTDKGIRIDLPIEYRDEFEELMYHHNHNTLRHLI